MKTSFSSTPPDFAVANTFELNSDGSGDTNVTDNSWVLPVIIICSLIVCALCIAATMKFREKYLQEMQFTEWMVSGKDVMATQDKSASAGAGAGAGAMSSRFSTFFGRAKSGFSSNSPMNKNAMSNQSEL
jgi:hypothetical protein